MTIDHPGFEQTRKLLSAAKDSKNLNRIKLTDKDKRVANEMRQIFEKPKTVSPRKPNKEKRNRNDEKSVEEQKDELKKKLHQDQLRKESEKRQETYKGLKTVDRSDEYLRRLKEASDEIDMYINMEDSTRNELIKNFKLTQQKTADELEKAREREWKVVEPAPKSSRPSDNFKKPRPPQQSFDRPAQRDSKPKPKDPPPRNTYNPLSTTGLSKRNPDSSDRKGPRVDVKPKESGEKKKINKIPVEKTYCFACRKEHAKDYHNKEKAKTEPKTNPKNGDSLKRPREYDPLARPKPQRPEWLRTVRMQVIFVIFQYDFLLANIAQSWKQ
jgi:hypothetical protein